MATISVDLDTIQSTTSQALVAHGAAPWIADSVAHAVRVAEAHGNRICGLFYLDSYCNQLRVGRVEGNVEPQVSQPKPASVMVDAKLGFAQAAFARGLDTALAAAKTNGVATLAICHSHTCTSMGYFTEQIARAGFIAIGMTNAKACVSPPGGTKAVLGTNPIAMSVPDGKGGLAMQFDQSTSAIAIGKINMAATAGEQIPLGWGVDSEGQATQDPNAVLKGGSLVSSGGYKGYGFGLMAEILAAAFTGGSTSTQLEPLKATEGQPHDLGQCYIIIDPTNVSGDLFWDKLTAISEAVTSQPGARLPGSQKVLPEAVDLDADVWQSVLKLASH
ncbi:MAG TPA: lactate dehydrogenase [Oceanospirillaceae bacterium]|nr:lactate dehydrogenase [Oceanospirillaceae bacterium]